MFVKLEDQPKGLENLLIFHKLVQQGSRLTVSLRRESDLTYQVEFDGVIWSLCCLEEVVTAFWPGFHRTKRGIGSVYQVMDSDLIRSLDPVDLIHHRVLAHYLIVTVDRKIDVIASSPPVFYQEEMS